MLAHTLLLIMTVTGSGIGDHAADVIRTVLAHAPSIEREGQPLAVRYEEAARQVTNWRLEAADDLEPRPLAAFAALIQADRPIVTRCVRLNNYWCIKRSRWNGEIGSDAEGHVGFESAESGADAAALLLRRYYLDFGRRSALEIVRRWAPADAALHRVLAKHPACRPCGHPVCPYSHECAREISVAEVLDAVRAQIEASPLPCPSPASGRGRARLRRSPTD